MNDFICANCMHGKKYRADCEWEYMYDGTDYANDCCDWWRPTNADHIRFMTDEELAEFIENDPMHDFCPNDCFEDPDRQCKVCALKWLKEEYKE